MKLAVLFASFVCLAAATPVALPEADTTKLCSCPEVYCAWSLMGECECKNQAADKCFQQQRAQGLIQCEKPIKKNCKFLHEAREEEVDTSAEETATTADLNYCGPPWSRKCPPPRNKAREEDEVATTDQFRLCGGVGNKPCPPNQQCIQHCHGDICNGTCKPKPGFLIIEETREEEEVATTDQIRLCGRPGDKMCPPHTYCAQRTCHGDVCEGFCKPRPGFLTIEGE